jgi:hypothetical protein
MRKVHNVGSDGGGGGGGSGSAAPSDTADNSGAEIDSPSPRFTKRPRQSHRSREQILNEISEVEREVVVRDEELREARQRKVDVLVRLERLRAELEDGRFSSSPCFSPTHIPCYLVPTSPPSVSAVVSRGSASCSPPAVLFPSSLGPSAQSLGTISLPSLPSPLGQSGYGFLFPSPPTPPAEVGSSSLYPSPAAPPPWLLPSSWPNN